MRTKSFGRCVAIAALVGVVIRCGGDSDTTGPSGKKDAGADATNHTGGSAGVDAAEDSSGGTAGDATVNDANDAGNDADADVGPSCVNLECQQVVCDGDTTALTGKVWDPAGKNPVYGAIVYVPNAKPTAIVHGATCDRCGTLDTASVATALSDFKGEFRVENVPVGTNIPLVIQIGKWRKQIVVPEVKACTDNPLDAESTRLPANKQEGELPRIALIGGCDPMHTLLEKIGIAHSEFTDEFGSGSVHVFKGSSDAGFPTATKATSLYGTLSKLTSYDLVLNECECAPYDRDSEGPGYANMAAYLDAGGRGIFVHYMLNFFGDAAKSDAEFHAAASWTLWSLATYSGSTLIDTSFPKGSAMTEWLQNLPLTSGWGPGIKTTPYGQLTSSLLGDMGGTVANKSQRWIYSQGGTAVQTLSMATPLAAASGAHCGRAIATDQHAGNGATSFMTENEASLEFMIFDLLSCIEEDATTPSPPAPNPKGV